ncbi:transcription termination/antitermination NusG family protein [Methylobacterium sp. WCS2018Hpa-22]|uniref:transcription termination/antitermination protein NusG n=1 Tax=Methylobacterium sp. WCS2018Hpa-22 TaxID=3073633 RepID=UPI00288BB7E1|nr:transcription termination/antitermination NusG family protein [Methylobacterium sp. WCS2018Hpa-22]
MARTKGKRQRERQRRQLRQERRVERRASAGTAAGLGMGSSAASARSAADPICGVASPTIDPTLCWYIAKTVPRMGVRALEALQAAEVVTYQPRASEVVVRRGRRVVRRTPMLIRTVFIGVKDEPHLAIARDRPGVAEIVCYPVEDKSLEGNVSGPVLKPAQLDAEGLQRFVDRIAKGEIVEPVGIKIGQGVMVTDGPFASFPATVERILPDDRIAVSVSLFGRASPIELNIAQVQLL